jgi:hypothetical protein
MMKFGHGHTGVVWMYIQAGEELDLRLYTTNTAIPELDLLGKRFVAFSISHLDECH